MKKSKLVKNQGQLRYSSNDWIPVLLPKQAVTSLLKRCLSKEGRRDSSRITREKIMEKLHKIRREVLGENPHAYINYNS